MTFRLVLPSLYLAVALVGWLDFARLPPDGLANFGLFVATLPVTLVGLLLGLDLVPDGHGYRLNHLLYYVPAVLVTAILPWWIGHRIDRWRARPGG